MKQEAVVEINNLIEKIYKGKIKKKAVEKRLDELEAKYEDIYYVANVHKKNPPWNKKYLTEYYESMKFDQRSKSCILYFSDVADSVYAKIRKRKIQIGAAIGCVVAIVAILKIVTSMNK